MRDFREIKVWEKAHLLTLEIYKATASFPTEGRYGLTRSADLARFLQIGMGSASEVEYHILLAKDLNLLSKKIYDDLNGRVVEVKRMLASLLMKVRRDR